MEKNQAQEEAIRHGDGPMLVLAGPGSGKTRVITERTAYLIEEHGVNPDQILVITFTKAAAMEMRQRFVQKTKGAFPQVTFGTFHAVFFHILQRAYGYTAANIVRREQQIAFIREALEKEDLEPQDEGELIQGLLAEIGAIKNNRLDVRSYLPVSCGKPEFLRIRKYYEERLHKSRLMDFEDMLVYCYELFDVRADILAGWQRKYRYILVDEFQDVNRIQYEITRQLAGPGGNLFVVGDDDQSIYRFRGAQPEIMFRFQEDFPTARRVLLDINYRCQERIVRQALCLIGHNTGRFAKQIRAARAPQDSVQLHDCRTMAEEAAWIVEDIRSKRQAGMPSREIAVLYRTGNQPRPLLEKMMEYNQPFCLKEGIPDLYQHWIARDLLAYIRIARGSEERKDFLTVMNRPNRYISREALGETPVTFAGLKNFYRGKDWMEERIERFSRDMKLVAGLTPYAAIHYIRHVMEYETYIRDYARERHMPEEELFDVLEEISEAARAYREFDAWFAYIERYRQEWREQMSKKQERTEAVSFLTMHGAKGLEFQTVYILEANEGVTPHKKAVTPEEIEEERRMFYVAMTRAKDELHICFVRERYGRKAEPSRFLGELSFDPEEFKEGSAVIHRKYGKGTIVRVDGDKAEILFERGGRRVTLQMAYCVKNGILRK